MAKLNILRYPEKILKRKCSPVKEITPEIKSLIEDMFETMYENQGVGLAANQVGKNLRLCVVDIRDGEKNNPIVLINPEIKKKDGKEFMEEGCLSFPGITASVKRFNKINVAALNVDGLPVDFEATGLLSRAIQHELDHINGIVFLARLPVIQRIKVFREYKKKANK